MTNPYADNSNRQPPAIGKAIFYSLLAHSLVVIFIVISRCFRGVSPAGKNRWTSSGWSFQRTGEDITGIQENKDAPGEHNTGNKDHP
jgi:hypothetical protein